MLFPSLPGEGKESVWGQWGLAVTFEMLHLNLVPYLTRLRRTGFVYGIIIETQLYVTSVVSYLWRIRVRLNWPCPLSKEFLLRELLTGGKFTGES